MAQLTPISGGSWPGHARDDIDRMNNASARLYEGRSIGTVERWRNPDSGNAGSVKLVRNFKSQGMPCHEMRYRIRFASRASGTSDFTVNWCKTQSGEWKTLEPAPRG
jgi:surface antigen